MTEHPAQTDELADARPRREPASLWRRLRAPLAWFVISAAIYGLFAWDRVLGQSSDPHFVELADSYLHGTLEMRRRPPHGNDWASYEVVTLRSGQVIEGNWYDRSEDKFVDLEGRLFILDAAERRGARWDKRYFVSFPPLPAVLMMPGVAIWGTSFNDVLFTLFFAALNVALLYALLRHLAARGVTGRSAAENGWLTVLFGFGSALLWCSVLGQVWFTALVVGVTFGLLYTRFAWEARHPFWAGLFLACAFATRTPLLFGVVLFAGFFFFPGGRFRRDFGRRFWRDGLLFVSVPIVVGVTLMVLNELRFDSLTEFGHRYLAGGQIDRIKEWGLFNAHFLSRNLAAMLALLPRFQGFEPYVTISKHGLAIWFTTPALLYCLWPDPDVLERRRRLHRILWVTVAAIAVPHLFYQNTGWVQFGYRFAVDYLPYLVLLLAIGGRALTGWFKLAIVWSMLVNAFGAVTFQRFQQFYVDLPLQL